MIQMFLVISGWSQASCVPKPSRRWFMIVGAQIMKPVLILPTAPLLLVNLSSDAV
jgi:hypothetical protein